VIGEQSNSWSSIGKSVGAKAKLCKIHVLVSELTVPKSKIFYTQKLVSIVPATGLFFGSIVLKYWFMNL
jgi:hypothetical protein